MILESNKMNQIESNENYRIKSEFLDFKYEKAKESIKESFWGDFLIGGLLVSSIFIIVDNLNLPQSYKVNIGIIILCFAIILIFLRLGQPKIFQFSINRMMSNVEKLFQRE